MMNNYKIIRRRTREYAVQALYSWQISKKVLSFRKMKLLLGFNIFSEIDLSYFNKIYLGTIRNIDFLNKIMIPHLSRKITELDYIERAVLQIALFELSRYPFHIPYKVTINEAIEIAKKFGAKDSYKFINGVLDKVVNDMNLKANKN